MNGVTHLALLLLLCIMVPVTHGALPPEARFAEAAQAYDAEEYDRAIGKYEQLLTDGFRSSELFFNLANAYFRAGDTGRAVFYYKNAWHLAPRDADIEHNLTFAAREADAAFASPSLITRWLQRLSLVEWIILATVAWWLTALYLCLVIWPSGRGGWGVTASLTLCLLVLSLAGVRHWLGYRVKPEVVIIKPGQEALFAPIAGTTPHFSLPPGSVARVDSVNEEWYRVRVGDKDGWIQRLAAARVTPWHSRQEWATR